MTFSALVLAGSRPGEDPGEICEGVPHKALIRLDGKSLIARVVEAVRAAGAQRVLVSCSLESVAHVARDLGCEVLEAQDGPSASVLAAFRSAGSPLLVTTADSAFLQADWVREIVAGTGSDCDLGVMLAERRQVQAAVPGSNRTYLKFADGAWSGCNLFYLRTDRAGRAITLWQTLEQERKKPWRIALRIGLPTLVSYLCRRLTLADAISRVGKGAGLEAKLVAATNGLAAFDIDKPSDLAEAQELIRRG